MTSYLSVEDILALEIAPFEGDVLDAAKGSEAAVDAGSVVCFVDGISDLHKQDVLNSTLLAQLAANKKFDRDTQSDKWYGVFTGTLQGLGWVVQSFTFSHNEVKGVTVSVDKLVIEYLVAFLTQPQLAAVNAVIDFLRKRSDKDPAITLFTTQSTKDKKSNFQLGACSETKNGDVSYSCGAFYYSTSERITNALFTKVRKGKVDFMNGFQNMTLNEQQYEKIRDSVNKKLGNNITKFIDDLDI